MDAYISSIENKMINAVDKKIGVIEHDYGNSTHYEYMMNRLGGEAHIAERYPNLMHMIQRSKEKHLVVRQNRADDVKMLKTRGGFSDSVKVDCINYDSIDLLSTAKADFIETKPIIAISAKLIDKSNDRIEDVINVYGEDDISRFQGIMKKLTSELVRSDDRDFKVVADFYWMNEDDNADATMASSTAVYDDIKVYGTSTIVANFVVNDPIPKHTPARDHVVVVYNREAQVGDDYDYSFNNNKEGDWVKILLPTSGTVTVSDDFSVEGLNRDMGYRLEIEDLNKGVVFYYAGMDTVTSAISGDGKSITWRFLDDWNNKLNVSNFHAKTTVNIYNRMGLDVVHRTGMKMTIPVVFQSKGSHSQDKSSILSKPVMIQWGCLGKDTRILMADNTYKPVSDIRIGDKVINERMESIEVRDIYIGPEEFMVNIETEKGKKILVTASHPVLTTRGMVAADRLTAKDKVITVDGEEELANLYMDRYDDKVYSLAFEEGNTIVGNGIHVGDFKHQQNINDAMAEEVPRVWSESCLLARNELKMLFDELAGKS